MATMRIGPRGEALIKGKETLRLTAYLPTPDDIPTIGWGHTKGVRLGMTITREQAQQFFEEDTAEAVVAVRKIAAIVPLSQSMFDALVSFVFNCGEGSVEPDKLVGGALRRRDYYAAYRGMSHWTKQLGKDLRGLAIRRALEMALFFEDRLPS
jgi:lysozyme